jgi:hypothetical protein
VKKVLTIAVCLVFVFGIVGVSFAQEKAAAKPAAQAEAKAAPAEGAKKVVVEEAVETVPAKGEAAPAQASGGTAESPGKASSSGCK